MIKFSNQKIGVVIEMNANAVLSCYQHNDKCVLILSHKTYRELLFAMGQEAIDDPEIKNVLVM
jgi:hypothetical protein